ncbi:MAG TPA: glucoamylase family protein, partial [Gemmatimonadales bacterium]|nr:glucoamylase family protein [Gemmatimonadales bacterium]
GFYYHFLDMNTGARFQTVELSTIDTGLLLAGVLTCQSYFGGSDSTETAIRAVAESLYDRADWRWIQPRAPLVAMGWTPESGFLAYDWKGFDEGMILYILALGSPTHAVDSTAWAAWTGGYQWGTFYGQTYLGFAPLFGHQFSHVWIDFRGIQDAYMRGRGIDYFENSRRATLAQQAYAVANPGRWSAYGAGFWGLTASDGPVDATLTVSGQSRQFHTYNARGASFTEIQDDGTVAPTAAGGSVPFAPEIAVPTLYAMRHSYGGALFSTYGFLDAVNPTFPTSASPSQGHVVSGVGWVDTDYLGIDQGPMLAMVENYRTGLIWRLLRGNAHIVTGLCRAGFSGGWLTGRC